MHDPSTRFLLLTSYISVAAGAFVVIGSFLVSAFRQTVKSWRRSRSSDVPGRLSDAEFRRRYPAIAARMSSRAGLP